MRSRSQITIDDAWLQHTIQKYAADFASKHNVPVHCNQWGVKDEVYDDHGRLAYACRGPKFTYHAPLHLCCASLFSSWHGVLCGCCAAAGMPT